MAVLDSKTLRESPPGDIGEDVPGTADALLRRSLSLGTGKQAYVPGLQAGG
jgi:hypothetical protein